jgi:hypothetical protein
MGKFQATPALRSDPESPQESRNLPKVRPSPRTPPPRRIQQARWGEHRERLSARRQ